MREIVSLPKETYAGYEITFAYESEIYYDVRIHDSRQGISVDFVRMPFPVAKEKSSTDKLYQPYWDGSEAYGILEDDKPIAIMEIWHESWNNRLRVTNLWIDAAHRRTGLGHQLMDYAKQLAAERQHRAIVLETQSCNANAIAFYLSQGFMLGGFDAASYSNEDIEKKEVRIEMLYRPSRTSAY